MRQAAAQVHRSYHPMPPRTGTAIFEGKQRHRDPSKTTRKICLLLAPGLGLVLCIRAACCNSQAQTTISDASKAQGSHPAVSCKKDTDCHPHQRCGFTVGCRSQGMCITPSSKTSCIDPGGRCGCDGRPVDIFCGVGSPTEYTSAPANAVGPCPRPSSRMRKESVSRSVSLEDLRRPVTDCAANADICGNRKGEHSYYRPSGPVEASTRLDLEPMARAEDLAERHRSYKIQIKRQTEERRIRAQLPQQFGDTQSSR